jgi:hypothetical protein
MGLKELVLLVPEFCVYLFAEVFGFGEVDAGLADRIGKRKDLADGIRVAIHIGIDAGAQVFLLTTA